MASGQGPCFLQRHALVYGGNRIGRHGVVDDASAISSRLAIAAPIYLFLRLPIRSGGAKLCTLSGAFVRVRLAVAATATKARFLWFC